MILIPQMTFVFERKFNSHDHLGITCQNGQEPFGNLAAKVYLTIFECYSSKIIKSSFT